MRYIMRRSCLFLVMIAVIVFTGCGQKKKEDPVTVTLWHVYGGQTESPLNDLIDEFNETIGKEENIRVQVGSVTNTNTIHENVLASAFGDPGASKLPDMFVSYPKTVLAVPDDTELVDYYDYFTEEELNEFSTSMREVMGYIKYSNNKEKLLDFLRTDTHKSIEMNAARVIKTITKTPIKISEEKEGIEMCQAIEELIAEK